MKVFLGGTCNGSTWRSEIIEHLDRVDVDYFDPVVDDWTEEAQKNELRERAECDFCLYVITPKMTGVYSIAEVVDDSHIRPKQTVFVILAQDGDDGFTEGQWKSLESVRKLVARNGVSAYASLEAAADYMGGC